mgnify:CR=1 FL=1
MKIAIRKSDGYILNSYMFHDGISHDYEAEKHIFSEEVFEEKEIEELLIFPEKDWFSKHYYFRNGKIEVSYRPQTHRINQELNRLRKELQDTDYKVIKSYETFLIGEVSEYQMKEVHVSRQAIRNKINELELFLKSE